MGAKESPIQAACISLLTLYANRGKLYFFRNNSFAGHIQRRNGSLGYIKNNNPGQPDVVASYMSKFIGIEIKAPGGRQSPMQKIAQQEIEASGGLYWIVTDVTQLQTKLEEIKNHPN